MLDFRPKRLADTSATTTLHLALSTFPTDYGTYICVDEKSHRRHSVLTKFSRLELAFNQAFPETSSFCVGRLPLSLHTSDDDLSNVARGPADRFPSLLMTPAHDNTGGTALDSRARGLQVTQVPELSCGSNRRVSRPPLPYPQVINPLLQTGDHWCERFDLS